MLIIDRRHRYYYNIILLCFCLFLLFLLNYDFPKRDSSFQKFFCNPSPIIDCTGDPLKQWCKNPIHLCNSSLIIFNKLFAKTHSIILQTKFAQGKRQGGEDLNNVLNQTEKDEYFHFEKGFIQVINLLISKKKSFFLNFSFHVIFHYQMKFLKIVIYQISLLP
jgi:hypothetical protein